MVIAIVNNKGGVGKTTTAVNLAGAFGASRSRVLLVDLDSQASASVWCGMERDELTPSIASCLFEELPLRQAIRRTAIPRVDLVTGSPELANADITLGQRAGRELLLRHVLDAARPQYDFVILDCPPGLSLVGVNALVAADTAIVPVTPQYLALDGLATVFGALEKARNVLGSRSRLLGIVVTQVEPRSRMVTRMRERVRSQFRERVFKTEIPLSESLRAAPAAGAPINLFAPRSRPAAAFRALRAEVLERLRAARHETRAANLRLD